MQVHAVPDSERAYDSTGRRLPWGFDFADAEPSKRRLPEERGPFGKARKRGTSRSKGATPARGQDQHHIDNLRAIDDIFSSFTKPQEPTKESSRSILRKSSATAGPPVSVSAPNLLEAAGLGGSLLNGNAAASNNAPQKEPTEVLIWGFGNDTQWAALAYYEKVSGGIIYEEYDRQPPNARYDLSLSQQRVSSYRSLSRSFFKKINEYVGGDHWIKVTFDSPEAAERACHYSPHNIQGYIVSAQRYVGRGPTEDVAVVATPGSRLASTTASPQPTTTSSRTLFGDPSSTTLSSATMTGTTAPSYLPRTVSEPLFQPSGSFPLDPEDLPLETNSPAAAQTTTTTTTSSSSTSAPGARARTTLRVRGAKPAVLLPPEKAFLPAPSRWQQTFGALPIIGWIIGPSHGIIGNQVPRKEDGSFDQQNATLYWRVWYSVDACLGTDFCGVRDAEYDD